MSQFSQFSQADLYLVVSCQDQYVGGKFNDVVRKIQNYGRIPHNIVDVLLSYFRNASKTIVQDSFSSQNDVMF